MIGEQEAETCQLRLKPLLTKGEERRVPLDDSAQIVAVLRTVT